MSKRQKEDGALCLVFFFVLTKSLKHGKMFSNTTGQSFLIRT